MGCNGGNEDGWPKLQGAQVPQALACTADFCILFPGDIDRHFFPCTQLATTCPRVIILERYLPTTTRSLYAKVACQWR